MNTKNFDTTVLLSITSGRLLCDGLDDMMEVADFLTGQPVFNHMFAMESFVDWLQAEVLRQIPELKGWSDTLSEGNWGEGEDREDNITRELGEAIAELGETRALTPASDNYGGSLDPMSTLMTLMSGGRD